MDSKQKRLTLLRVIVGWILAVSPLAAHHGTAASYDQQKVLTVKGVVTQFLWRNPHSALFLETKDQNGKSAIYSVEMFSPGLMVKQGYTRTSFKVGDEVVLELHPSLAGEPVGECLGCKVLVNGKDPAKKQ